MAFFAVGSDPTESLARLENYRRQEGHPWPVAEGVGTMLRNFNVVQQSTKIAIDSRGLITYRAGYGRGDSNTWRQLFKTLASLP